MDRNAPVGVFDSGIGGLTVVREIIRQMPEERIVYFGDTARLPYGSKSRDTVIRYSRQIIRFLLTKQVKAIVIACNTASAYALETVEQEFDLPIIGVIRAGALTAVRSTRNGKIGVIGTEGTIGSGIYTEVIKQMDPSVEVTGKACPLFVPLVEEGLLHDSVTDEIASRYLSVLKGRFIDTLVLGCTHYPLLRSTLGRLMGSEVTLVNPAYETALELKALLDSRGLARTDPGTCDEAGLRHDGSRISGLEIDPVARGEADSRHEGSGISGSQTDLVAHGEADSRHDGSGISGLRTDPGARGEADSRHEGSGITGLRTDPVARGEADSRHDGSRISGSQMNPGTCDDPAGGGKYQFYVSDLAEKFTAFATSILPEQVKATQKIDIENY